jgi:CBS domain
MLTSADVMTADVVSVEPDTPVRDIAQLLYTRRISGVPVVEQGHLIGIVSEGAPNSGGRLGPICWRTTLSLRTASFVSPGSFSPKMSDEHSALRLRIFRVSKVLRTILRFGPLHRSK